MKQKTMYGVLTLATISLLLLGGVSAFGGFGKGVALTDEERAEMDVFHEQVQTAIDNEDYAAWAALMESEVTQENFELLVERHAQMQEVREIREQMREARESGDTETFEVLRSQLQELASEAPGFGQGMIGARGQVIGQGMGGMHGNCPFA